MELVARARLFLGLPRLVVPRPSEQVLNEVAALRRELREGMTLKLALALAGLLLALIGFLADRLA